MRKDICSRVLSVCDYVLKTGKTVREVAKVFGVSKSTIHYDLKFRLRRLDLKKWRGVKKVLDINLKQRHIRGGIATKNKYEKLKNNN